MILYTIKKGSPLKSAIILSILSSILLMGEEISSPYTPPEPNTRIAPHSLYAGGGFSHYLADDDTHDITANALTEIVGYQLNRYFGVEGRFSATLGKVTFDDGVTKKDRKKYISNKSLYLKGTYPVYGVQVYGLLGYGETVTSKMSESGLQWGAGVNYTLGENYHIYADYTRMYDDAGFKNDNFSLDNLSLGVLYSF